MVPSSDAEGTGVGQGLRRGERWWGCLVLRLEGELSDDIRSLEVWFDSFALLSLLCLHHISAYVSVVPHPPSNRPQGQCWSQIISDIIPFGCLGESASPDSLRVHKPFNCSPGVLQCFSLFRIGRERVKEYFYTVQYSCQSMWQVLPIRNIIKHLQWNIFEMFDISLTYQCTRKLLIYARLLYNILILQIHFRLSAWQSLWTAGVVYIPESDRGPDV